MTSLVQRGSSCKIVRQAYIPQMFGMHSYCDQAAPPLLIPVSLLTPQITNDLSTYKAVIMLNKRHLRVAIQLSRHRADASMRIQL